MGLFSAFHAARNFAGQHGGVQSAGQAARSAFHQSRDEWNNLHGSMPGVREYVGSAEGRASMRSAAGMTFHRYIQDKTKKSLKKGNYLRGALFQFASLALQHQMDALKHDQRIFTNVAKVRRGDPEMTHLTHNELREVTDHAKKYGGHDADAIKTAAQGELDRRQTRKNMEWDRGEAGRDRMRLDRRKEQASEEGSVRAQVRMAANQRLHEQESSHEAERHQKQIERLQQLRTESGHSAQAKIAHEQARLKLRKEAEKAKTQGVKSRQTAIQGTLKAKAKILKETAHGAIVQGAHGSTYTVSKARAQKMKSGAAAPRGSKRKRAVTAG